MSKRDGSLGAARATAGTRRRWHVVLQEWHRWRPVGWHLARLCSRLHCISARHVLRSLEAGRHLLG